MQAIPQPADCCSTCPDPSLGQIPGPQGPAGTNGTNGTDGKNAYTLLTEGFTMPAAGADILVSVVDSNWMMDSAGEIVIVDFAGYFIVVDWVDPTSVVLRNASNGTTTYITNAAAGTAIPNSSKVSPAGMQGISGSLTGTLAGQVAGSPTSNTIVALTLKGDLLVGAGASAASRLGVGANGTRPVADSTQTLGVGWGKVNIASTAEVTGILPLNQGGTGATTATTARAALGIPTPSMATQVPSAVVITGGSISGLSPALPIASGGTGASNASTARQNLGILGGYGILGSRVNDPSLPGAGVNTEVTGDYPMGMLSASYIIDKVIIVNADGSTSAAVIPFGGLFSGASGGGTAICANQTLAGLTAGSKFKLLTQQAITGTDALTFSSLNFNIATASTSAGYIDVYVMGWKLD